MTNFATNAMAGAITKRLALAQAPEDGDTPQPVEEAVEATVEATVDTLRMVLTIGIGAAAGLLAGLLAIALLRILSRSGSHMEFVVRAISRRLQILLIAVGAFFGFRYGRSTLGHEAPGWFDFVNHMAIIAIILLATWVLSGLVNGVTQAVNESMAETSEGRAARVKTQTQILRRVAVVVVWILGIAAVLLTFPGARAAGASIFASAGIASVVVGLAAQTTLGSVFAGLQLAFTDSIRVGDIVHYQGNYTTVEEITLTYVVLAVWDGRRIIVPSSIMTTESFENWTRRAPEMTGDVLIKVDWQVPIDAARLRLEQILAETDLWDGRTGVLQVSDASTTEGIVLRCLISAESSPKLTDLRNHVREEMVLWIQEEAPQAAPHTRIYKDEKGDFWETRQYTEALVRKREELKPPVFVPVVGADGSASGITQETEIISGDDVERLRRIPISERGSQLDDHSAASGQDRGHGRDADTAEVSITSQASTTQSGTVKSAIFSGSPEAEARARAYAGPGDEAYEERKRKIEDSRSDLSTADDDDSENSEETS